MMRLMILPMSWLVLWAVFATCIQGDQPPQRIQQEEIFLEKESTTTSSSAGVFHRDNVGQKNPDLFGARDRNQDNRRLYNQQKKYFGGGGSSSSTNVVDDDDRDDDRDDYYMSDYHSKKKMGKYWVLLFSVVTAALMLVVCIFAPLCYPLSLWDILSVYCHWEKFHAPGPSSDYVNACECL